MENQNHLIVELHSPVERLDLTRIFPRPQPLQVELGCGDASFVVDYAKRHPESNFVGVERLLGRLRKLDRKGRRAGLTNLRGVRIESSYFLEYLLPPHSVSALHVYFPDPWPKKRHHKNRLVNERFPEIARAALRPDGVVYLRTDDQDYFKQITEVFNADKNFKEIETPIELAELSTDFENEFRGRGIKTFRAAYRLNVGS
ncbi:MAG: tRNA (guanosine(46)-N7)-methyltransferase TrmB [Verrucomicrobiota bacterium]|jgi:tRNA (guanine-N7-)-methyltransferase